MLLFLTRGSFLYSGGPVVDGQAALSVLMMLLCIILLLLVDMSHGQRVPAESLQTNKHHPAYKSISHIFPHSYNGLISNESRAVPFNML